MDVIKVAWNGDRTWTGSDLRQERLGKKSMHGVLPMPEADSMTSHLNKAHPCRCWTGRFRTGAPERTRDSRAIVAQSHHALSLTAQPLVQRTGDIPSVEDLNQTNLFAKFS